LAGARAGSVEPCPQLDRLLRDGTKGLAETRSRVSGIGAAMMTRGRVLAVVFSLSVPALIVARAQAPVPAPAPVHAPRPPTQNHGVSGEGIPLPGPVGVRAWGSCPTRDDKQRMTRISDRRATPENWELTIRRMMSLNNVKLPPEVARDVIK